MIKKIQQLGLMAIALLLVAYGSSFIAPPPVHAQYVVEDLYNGVVDTLTSIASGASEYIQNAEEIDNTYLKDLAIGIAKQMLQQLTLSVVKWINSGFQGSPAFVQNPEQYFENLGNDIAGNFLQQNANLKFLCSPFNLDIRVALAVKMQPDKGQQYTCTLTQAITNASNAVNGASITGFVGGDFSQGGFPAFFTLTTQPQNNAGGAYLKAESDLTQKINASVNQKASELNQGAGFLSYQTCTYTATDGSGKKTPITKQNYNDDINDDVAEYDTKSCTTQTPGSVISGVLNKQLGVPTDELELAKDLNAIVSAAFSELVLQVFNGGLGSVTGSGGAGSAYLTQLASESSAQQQQLQQSVIQGLASNLSNAQQYKYDIDQSLNVASTAYALLNSALQCWENPALLSSPIYQAQAQNQIGLIQNSYIPTIAPLITTFSQEDQSASSSINAILEIENSTDLTSESLQVTSLTADQLITTQDIGQASQAIKTTQTTVDPITTDADNSLKQCQQLTGVASTTPL